MPGKEWEFWKLILLPLCSGEHGLHMHCNMVLEFAWIVTAQTHFDVNVLKEEPYEYLPRLHVVTGYISEVIACVI